MATPWRSSSNTMVSITARVHQMVSEPLDLPRSSTAKSSSDLSFRSSTEIKRGSKEEEADPINSCRFREAEQLCFPPKFDRLRLSSSVALKQQRDQVKNLDQNHHHQQQSRYLHWSNRSEFFSHEKDRDHHLQSTDPYKSFKSEVQLQTTRKFLDIAQLKAEGVSSPPPSPHVPSKDRARGQEDPLRLRDHASQVPEGDEPSLLNFGYSSVHPPTPIPDPHQSTHHQFNSTGHLHSSSSLEGGDSLTIDVASKGEGFVGKNSTLEKVEPTNCSKQQTPTSCTPLQSTRHERSMILIEADLEISISKCPARNNLHLEIIQKLEETIAELLTLTATPIFPQTEDRQQSIKGESDWVESLPVRLLPTQRPPPKPPPNNQCQPVSPSSTSIPSNLFIYLQLLPSIVPEFSISSSSIKSQYNTPPHPLQSFIIFQHLLLDFQNHIFQVKSMSLQTDFSIKGSQQTGENTQHHFVKQEAGVLPVGNENTRWQRQQGPHLQHGAPNLQYTSQPQQSPKLKKPPNS